MKPSFHPTLLDFIAAAHDLEEAVLAPLPTPRVHAEPVGRARLLSPADHLDGVEAGVIGRRQVRPLIDAASVHQEIRRHVHQSCKLKDIFTNCSLFLANIRIHNRSLFAPCTGPWVMISYMMSSSVLLGRAEVLLLPTR